ncbi:hypothetical protein DDB_G0279457 [Dictyostelium discoideum AX4]|uniref:Uncharacterized protein n=1 Tax=Dictyostelium discoideum TaxID=44689 RepID=Q54WT1_DICDI|nr:hypothetical protein DDB_G0279457 [Dictyostelium discoideum AX4]EAL67667.1 hypothetical protein DDB_G0279457 [Dictyostelium discoideum AX4]|eukprot:XP_641636.1 hypothetical protein DDB_G0279457 [Dictyostelium discoideum AX4]
MLYGEGRVGMGIMWWYFEFVNWRVKSDQHQWEVVIRYKHFRVFQINNEVFNSSSSTPSSIYSPSSSALGGSNYN